MTTTDFLLPDLGEGLTESEIVSWRIAEGDRVELNQVIAEVETAKALVELPSPRAGVVARLYVGEGVTVNVGDPIVAFEVDGAPESAPPNLVGYGAAETSGKPQRRQRAFGSASISPVAAPVGRTRATPPVRKFAREHGIDLGAIVGTGDRGTITRADAERAVGSDTVQSSDDRVVIPVKGVRKLTADAMVASAFTAPHVTVFVTVDVTRTMKLLGRLDTRVTFLSAVSRAVCIALAQHPEINARFDEQNQSIIQFGAAHLGIAAATPRGLLVPVVRNAGRLTMLEFAKQLRELVEVAREGKTQPADLTGGTFTISNVGVFGVDAGTPILNDGQAGVLAVGAVTRRPWEHHSKIRLRSVTTLSLSFDHRVLDGGQGSRFLATVARLLSDPGNALALA